MIKKKIEDLRKEIAELEKRLREMSSFESVVIINVRTTLKELQNIQNEIKKLVELDGDFENIGLKKLAYEIKTEIEGYYIHFIFVGTKDDVSKLEDYYYNNDAIIKFLNVLNVEEGAENE